MEVLLELGRLEGRSSCPATVVTLSLTARRYEAGLNTLIMRVASSHYCLADWLSLGHVGHKTTGHR